MLKKLYVGNLSFNTTENQVRDMFLEYGDVESVAMIMDRNTNRFRGFGFVEMAVADADKAIEGLNGKNVDGRDLTVNEAKPRTNNGGGGRSNNRQGGNGSNGSNRFPHSGGGRRY